MTASIFKAVGRGYSARSILGAIGRKAPEYANTINNAYYAGYAADHILSRIASKKDGKNYNSDMFLTEHEKTLRNHEKNKKYAVMEAIGMAGTAGSVGAGIAQLYSYLQKQKALHPDEIIIPDKKYLRKNPHTINQGKKQVGYDQKKLGYDDKGKDDPKSLPNHPMVPSEPHVKDVSNSSQKNPPPPQYKNVPPAIFQRDYPGKDEPAPPPNPENSVKPYVKSLKVLEGLGEANRIINMIEGGMTNDEMKLVLPMMMPKEAYNIISKGQEMDRLLNDMQEYVKENPREKKELQNTGFQQNMGSQGQDIDSLFNEQFGIEPEYEEQPQPQQMQSFEPQMQPQQMDPYQNQQMQAMGNPQQNEQAPMEIPYEDVEPEETSRLVHTKSGQSGDLIGIKNGVATLDIGGKEQKVKFSDLETAPQSVEQAIRQTLNSIPEKLKSTNLMGTVHIPGIDMMLTTFYSGKMAWYKNVPLERYNRIVFSSKSPKGQARTGIAEYNPNSSDSRGSEYHDFKMDPMYSKANEGKTWGYIDNKYNVFDHVQGIIDKISKERYDADGNLITPKARVKKETANPKAEKPVSSPKPKEKPKDEESKAKPTDWKKEVEKIDKRTNLLTQSIKLLEKNYPTDDDSYYTNIKRHESQLSIYQKEINDLKKRKDDLLVKNQKFQEKKSEFEPSEETQSEWEKRIKKTIPGITDKAIQLMSYKYSKKFKD